MSDDRKSSEETRQRALVLPEQSNKTEVSCVQAVPNGDYRDMMGNQNIRDIQYGFFAIPTSDRPLAECRLGYRRCFDFDPSNTAGQDFAAVRADAEYVVGIVADGVSQSFFGDIAAKQVSLFLLDELWHARAKPTSKEELEDRLHSLEAAVAARVKDYPLPKHLPELQLGALEKVRTRGSQTVFGAFILDLKNRELTAYRVGDAETIVGLTGNSVALSKDPGGRWSSAGNSRLLLKVDSYQSCEGVVIKSDGAGDAWGRNIHERETLTAEAFVQLASNQAAKDDVAFVAVLFDSSQRKSESLTGPTTHATFEAKARQPRGEAQYPPDARSQWALPSNSVLKVDPPRNERGFTSKESAESLRGSLRKPNSEIVTVADGAAPRRDLFLTRRDFLFLALGLVLGMSLNELPGLPRPTIGSPANAAPAKSGVRPAAGDLQTAAPRSNLPAHERDHALSECDPYALHQSANGVSLCADKPGQPRKEK